MNYKKNINISIHKQNMYKKNINQYNTKAIHTGRLCTNYNLDMS